MAEIKENGIFNAAGPAHNLSIGEMLVEMKRCIDLQDKIHFNWVNSKFLKENNIESWSQMPVWIPPGTSMSGLCQINMNKAKAKRLQSRPIEQTISDTLDWALKKYPTMEEQDNLKAGITRQKEKDVLSKWEKLVL